MRKVIWAINVTIDGFADHTAVIADEELHDFFTDLLGEADCIIFGRKTYELMESYWPKASEDPACTKSELRFAERINSISKIVISNTLEDVSWNNTRLTNKNPVELISDLKKENGKPIAVGSINVAAQLINYGLIDEFWFLVHPVILGNGSRPISQLMNRAKLQLLDMHSLKSGVVVLHYKP